MAIEPINGVSMRPDLTAMRRQNQAGYPGDAPNDSAAGGAPNNPLATAAGQRLPPQLLQMMQQGRETSGLLSTLPGPNLSFFQPPAPPPGFTANGQAPRGLAGPGQRVNAPLLEMEQQGQVTSALLSPMMGPNMAGQDQRVFPAPTPPTFAGANPAGTMTNPAPLRRAGAQLLETEQAGRQTSALLSGLMGSMRPAGSSGTSSFAGPGAGSATGGPPASMRTAKQVIQTVGTASPSAMNMRIANEAYQMEAQAQQDYSQRAANGGPTWEWFA
jgi:hypothetical protein